MARHGRLDRGLGSETDPTTAPLSCFDSIHELCVTPRTVGMSETAIGRIDATGLSVRPQRHPALAIGGRSGLVSNEKADTTHGHHCSLTLRCAEA